MKLTFNIVLKYAFYVFFFLSFFSIPVFSFNENLNYLTWVFTICLLIVLLLRLLFYSTIKITFITVSYLLFIVSATIGSMFNKFINFSFSVFLNVTVFCAIYTYFISFKESDNTLFYILFLSVFGFSLLFLIIYRNEIFSGQITRLGSLFGDNNDIAIYLSIGFTLGFTYIFQKHKLLSKIIVAVASIVILACSLLCGSKIVILIMAGICLYNICSYFGKSKWYISLSIVASAFIIVILLLCLPPFKTIKDRILSMIYTLLGIAMPYQIDYSTINRINMFNNGISLFLRRPLFGFGVSGFKTFSTYHNGWSHNHISETLCNYGIIGTFLFHFPIFLVLFKRKNKNDPFFALLLMFIISMISVALFYEKMFTYLFGIMLSKIDSTPLLEIDIKNIGKKNNENCRSY